MCVFTRQCLVGSFTDLCLVLFVCLRQDLLVNMELTVLARLTGHQAPEIPLVPPCECWGYSCRLLDMAFTGRLRIQTQVLINVCLTLSPLSHLPAHFDLLQMSFQPFIMRHFKQKS